MVAVVAVKQLQASFPGDALHAVRLLALPLAPYAARLLALPLASWFDVEMFYDFFFSFFSLFFFLFAHFYFPASGQAMVSGVVPSSPWFLPSIFIAHRVQQSHCS